MSRRRNTSFHSGGWKCAKRRRPGSSASLLTGPDRRPGAGRAPGRHRQAAGTAQAVDPRGRRPLVRHGQLHRLRLRDLAGGCVESCPRGAARSGAARSTGCHTSPSVGTTKSRAGGTRKAPADRYSSAPGDTDRYADQQEQAGRLSVGPGHPLFSRRHDRSGAPQGRAPDHRRPDTRGRPGGARRRARTVLRQMTPTP
jgi:hypothetical protein